MVCLKIENSAFTDSSVISSNFYIKVIANGCNDNSSDFAAKTISTTIVYLQSGITTLTVFSGGTSYYTPPATPCSLPAHEIVGSVSSDLTLDADTGELTVTSNTI